MYKFQVFIVFITISLNAYAFPIFERAKENGSIFEVGNGGDSVACRFEDELGDVYTNLDYLYGLREFRHLYRLMEQSYFDSIQKFSFETRMSDFSRAEPSSEPMLRVGQALLQAGVISFDVSSVEYDTLQLLKKHAPQLGASFEDFLYLKFNVYEEEQRVWLPIENKDFIDIKDEKVEFLNESCDIVFQQVIRLPIDGKIYYFYDPAHLIIFQGASNSLVQSFLTIHEWLWDFTQDVETIRLVNWFLHSQDAREFSTEEFRDHLDRIGLKW